MRTSPSKRQCATRWLVAIIAAASVVMPTFAAKMETEYEDIHDRYKTERDVMDVQIGEYEDISVFMGLKTAGRFQYLTQDDVYITPRPTMVDPMPAPVDQGDLDPGFQTAWGSMDFLAKFGEDIEVYWEFFISSRPHASEMQGSQGYMIFHSLPGGQLQGLFDLVDIKAGQFEMNYGDHIYRRTDNARTHRNPLIGNYVVDARSTDIGLEISTKNELFNVLVGAGSGTEAEDFTEDRGTAVHGKLWLTPTDTARLSASAFWVDHSDNSAGFGEGTRANLYRTSRSGGPYGGILDDGNAPGQVFIGNGQDVFGAQGDLTLLLGSVELYGHVGVAEDNDENGSAPGAPNDSWTYYAAEAVVPITENTYGAIRYSAAQADDLNGSSSNGDVQRLQVGGGFWVTDYILAKMEYVFQDYSGFKEGESVSGVDAWNDPQFQGVVAEVSLAF